MSSLLRKEQDLFMFASGGGVAVIVMVDCGMINLVPQEYEYLSYYFAYLIVL